MQFFLQVDRLRAVRAAEGAEGPSTGMTAEIGATRSQ
jgi:hypothetical protein